MNILKKIDLFKAFEKMLKNLTFRTSPNWKALFNSLGDLTVLEYALSEKNIFRPIVTLKKNDLLSVCQSWLSWWVGKLDWLLAI